MTCGNCPFPSVGTPSVSGGPHRVSDRDQVVIRWSAVAKDPLPDSYYQRGVIGRPATHDPVEEPSVVEAWRATGVRELTIDLIGMDAFLAANPNAKVELPIFFQDTRTALPCHHPGMPDRYWAPLRLLFRGHNLESASFGPMHMMPGPLWRHGVTTRSAVLSDSIFKSSDMAFPRKRFRIVKWARCRRLGRRNTVDGFTEVAGACRQVY